MNHTKNNHVKQFLFNLSIPCRRDAPSFFMSSLAAVFNNAKSDNGEFAIIRSQAGLNSYKISVKEWVDKTNVFGLRVSAGWYGAYTYKDVAFEFDVTDIVTDKMTDKEIKIMQYLQASEFVTNSIVCEITDVAEATAKRLLKKMTDKGLLDAVGENRARKYTLKR